MKNLGDAFNTCYNRMTAAVVANYHAHVTEEIHRYHTFAVPRVAYDLMAIVEAQFTKEGYTSDGE